MNKIIIGIVFGFFGLCEMILLLYTGYHHPRQPRSPEEFEKDSSIRLFLYGMSVIWIFCQTFVSIVQILNS